MTSDENYDNVKCDETIEDFIDDNDNNNNDGTF